MGKSSVRETGVIAANSAASPQDRRVDGDQNANSLSLVEVDDFKQRPVTMLLNNAHWNMPVTENPVLDSTEIWELINTTDDSHPIHLHLVRFQVLDRRKLRYQWLLACANEVRYKARRCPPAPSEMGGRIRFAPTLAWSRELLRNSRDIPGATCGTATFSSTKTTR